MRSEQRWFAAGVSVVAGFELTIGRPAVAGLVLYPGMVAAVASCGLCLPAVWAGRAGMTSAATSAPRRLWVAWVFAATVAVADLPAMTARPDSLSLRLAAVVAGILLATALILPLLRLPRRHGPGVEPSRRDAWVTAVWALATIAMFQSFNRWLRSHGVPNEDRSLIVGGIEVHHLSWGVLILVVGVLAWVGYANRRRPARAVIGLGVGLVLDQCGYLPRARLTDAAYFDVWTLACALIALAACLVIWLTDVRRLTR